MLISFLPTKNSMAACTATIVAAILRPFEVDHEVIEAKRMKGQSKRVSSLLLCSVLFSASNPYLDPRRTRISLSKQALAAFNARAILSDRVHEVDMP